MPEPTPRSRSVAPLRGIPRHASRASARPAAKAASLPAWRALAASLTLVAVLLGGAATAQDAAQDTDAVTPDKIAALIPDTWQGLAASEHQATFDRSGAAMASARYDDTSDQRASRDLTLAVTDLGPYRDATLLVYRADAAEGRKQETTVGGYPAFAATDFGDPTLDVFAGRLWVRTRAFGELYSADDLRAAVEALPLDAIHDLSDRPVSAAADYRPLGFTPGALRHFLPETVLGLPRSDGYYAKRHPAGVVWGGYPYSGSHGGQDVRVRLTVWDLGTLSDATRERLASQPDAWQGFTQGGHTGFVEQGTPTPRVLLYAGRFRLQIDAPGQPGVGADWLRGAFDEVDLGRLAKLAGLVPAPDPARDPLRPQPELVAPDALASALPADLAGMARGDVNADVSSRRGQPYDTAYAQAPYRTSAGATVRVTVFDQGLVPLDVREQMAAMREVDAGGRAIYVSDEQGAAIVTVGDRLVVTAQAARGDGPEADADALVRALSALDFGSLEKVAGTGSS